MDDSAQPGAAWPAGDAARLIEALRDKLAVVIADTEVAQLMARRSDVRARLARVLEAAWGAEALLPHAAGRPGAS
jgi:hypothetical protein